MAGFIETMFSGHKGQLILHMNSQQFQQHAQLAQSRQNPTMEWGGEHEVLPLPRNYWHLVAAGKEQASFL